LGEVVKRVAPKGGSRAASVSRPKTIKRRATKRVDDRGWPYTNNQPLLPPSLDDNVPWPRISVVTPSFNQGTFIEETILSVANQGYPNVEHIIIDGESSDRTVDVLRRYSDTLAYWVSEPDRGQSHAINKGMARSTGEILTWLNADDRLAPGALAAVALASHYSGADMVAGVAELYRDKQLIRNHITACSNGLLPLDDLLDLERCWYAGQFFYQPEVMFRRDLWQRSGGRVDESLHYSMDYELWIRFAEQAARLHVIGRPIAQFRMHALQKTNEDRFRPELERLNRDILTRLGRSTTGKQPANQPARRPLRVVMLNDIGFNYGAGGAHKRIAQAFARAGAAVVSLSLQQGLTPSRPTRLRSVVSAIKQARPDLVIFGNLHGAKAPPQLVDGVAWRWPTFWVLHDFWFLTGRCAYTAGCEKLLTGCDATCPTPKQYPRLPPDQIRPAWAVKRRILRRRKKLFLLANSSYTHHFARRALGMESEEARRVEGIRLGVPTQIFGACDKATARRLLNVDKKAFVLGMAASSLSDRRKGSDLLLDAVSQLRIPNLIVLAAGWCDPKKPSPLKNLRQLGYIDNPTEMAVLYSAADLFIGASQEETLGQVYIEAAACGTPVVAFRTSGLNDAVKDGISGILLPAFSAKNMARKIEWLYNNAEERRRLSVLGRYFVENEFSLARTGQSLIAMLIRTGLIDGLQLPRNASMEIAIPDLECDVLNTTHRQHGLAYSLAIVPRRSWWKVVEGLVKTKRAKEIEPPGVVVTTLRNAVRVVFPKGRPVVVTRCGSVIHRVEKLFLRILAEKKNGANPSRRAD
jgi:glycosyltransferase involved in cell wall biosynthesis